MPEISLIPIPYYQPLDPYNHVVDNLPIQALADRIDMVNFTVDNQQVILNSAAGSSGTIDARLNESLEDNGDLKTVKIDQAMHSIEAHTDTANFVRMTVSERDKISFIEDQANLFNVNISLISSEVFIPNGTLELAGSDSIQWNFIGGRLFPTTNFPASVRHFHYYGQQPVDQNLITPDYQNYFVTSLATPYRAGSLRVYINGVRLAQGITTPVPFGYPGPITYSSMTFFEGAVVNEEVPSGSFSLSSPITPSTTIFIDFDVTYA